MTDVLGICESWEADTCVVRREDGTAVRIAVADIVSGKPVPPRPSMRHRFGAEEADRLVLPGWPALESARLGDWLLRASGGFSSRGNSVLALGDPGVPLDEAVARVAGWYADRSLPARAHVHPRTPQAEAFRGAGWSAYDPTLLMLGSVARVLRRLADSPDLPVRHEVELDPAWLATDDRAARFGESARSLLESGDVVFATIREGEDVVARGRGSRHGDWVGVSSLWTAPERRGAGLGGAVLRSLLDWGAEHGALTAYLQVLEANVAVWEMYAARGFEVHHRYDYVVEASAT